MNNQPSSRVWTSLSMVLLAASFGALFGHGAGIALSITLAKHALYRYAAEHSKDVDQPADESRALLSAMNSAHFATCSEDELSFFRHLMLRSSFFKEAGRMHGGHFACSTTFTRVELPRTEYQPSFRGAAGTTIYTNVDGLQVGPVAAIVIRSGDAYVATNPYSQGAVPPGGIQFTLTSAPEVGASSYLNGSHSKLPLEALTRSGKGSLQGILYATDCSPIYHHCGTLFVPVQTAVRHQRILIAFCAATGGIIGGSFGLMSVLLYRRKKGIEQQLRRAIRRNKLQVVYQPLVELTTRRVTGAEALVRWTDEDRLVIPPDVFIKIAERRGFIDQITRLVVHRVLADFGRHLGEHPDFRINVNVAASDLTDPAFHRMLEDALLRASVSPANIGIEITEGQTAKHEQAIKAIAQLRCRGHYVSIDDFGTGYSSLAYLKDLAVDGIKIDRAFTSAIGTGAVTVGILPQILSMADALQLSVVAEGIETEAQYAYYRAYALTVTGQGWLFGRPVSPDEFRRRWMEATSNSREDGPTEEPNMEALRRRMFEHV